MTALGSVPFGLDASSHCPFRTPPASRDQDEGSPAFIRDCTSPVLVSAQRKLPPGFRQLEAFYIDGIAAGVPSDQVATPTSRTDSGGSLAASA